MKKLLTILLIAIIVSQIEAQTKPLKKDTIKVRKQTKGCDPVTRVGKYFGNCEVTLNEIKIAKAIFAKTCSEYDGLFEIVSFEFTVTYQKKVVDSYRVTGNKFTNEILDALGKIKPKQLIYIENVKCKGPDGSIRNIPGITLLVK